MSGTRVLPLLKMLDGILTGNPEDRVAIAAREWPKTAKEWTAGLYGPGGRFSEIYLSDGGYSRILVDAGALENGAGSVLGVGSVSLDGPKNRWNTLGAIALRRQIEVLLQAAFDEMAGVERRHTSGTMVGKEGA